MGPSKSKIYTYDIYFVREKNLKIWEELKERDGWKEGKGNDGARQWTGDLFGAGRVGGAHLAGPTRRGRGAGTRQS